MSTRQKKWKGRKDFWGSPEQARLRHEYYLMRLAWKNSLTDAYSGYISQVLQDSITIKSFKDRPFEVKGKSIKYPIEVSNADYKSPRRTGPLI